ncbi:uncharacterized protein LOC128860442 [Anastrepha ludens]|uniref:Odorant binding protein 50a n=1 Tax=Anastrepha ludens TaxID=28586 RepID=A0A9E8DAA9_9MUSC|nr:uncharacterized protein LOC128860442 [Anastrepha ludens]UZH23335.1 odorant binding protein 50a [Anastrepha ludens]
MKCLVSLLLLAALLGVNAYEFDDSTFNEYLFKELQSLQDDDIADDLPTHRARRETEVENSAEKEAKECAKHNWKKDMHCCKGSNVNDEQLELFMNVKKECIAELKGEPADDAYDPFNCDKMQQVKEQMICVAECVGKKFHSIDENGQFKRDVILEQLRKQIGDVQWKKDAIEGYVDKCLAEVKEKHEQLEKAGKLSEGCSRCPLAFSGCMWREFWNGCPAELHVDTPKCNKLRERVTKNDIQFFGKHLLFKYYPNSME